MAIICAHYFSAKQIITHLKLQIAQKSAIAPTLKAVALYKRALTWYKNYRHKKAILFPKLHYASTGQTFPFFILISIRTA